MMRKLLLTVIGGCIVKANLLAGIVPKELEGNGGPYGQMRTKEASLSGARVVPPGLIVGKDRQIEGVMSSTGQVLGNGGNVNGTVSADGSAYDSKGNAIGRDTGGKRIYFDEKDRVISPEKALRLCAKNQKNEEFCVQKKFDGGPFDSLDDAVLAAADGLNSSECKFVRPKTKDEGDAGIGVEAGLNLYRESNAGGKFFFGYKAWYADRGVAAERAPSLSDDLNLTGFSLVGHLHNHPNTVPGYNSDFFSLNDWNAAKSRNVPSYMMPCFLNGGGTTPRMLRLDPLTGDVYERAVLMGADGKLSYGGGWSAKPIYNFNGVLGWCACKRGSFEKLEWMGIPLVSIKDMEECCDICGEIFGEEWYVKDEFKRAHEEVSWCGWKGAVYYLCVECGKACKDLCIRPEEFPAYAEKLAKLVKSQNKQGVKELKMQSADFRRVSDGEIVVRGVCECSSPHEIRANFWTHVCKACGRLVLNPKEK